MAIRFKIDGIDVECDAPQEAAALIAALKNQHVLGLNGSTRHAEPVVPEKTGSQGFASFWQSTDEVGQKMLRAVAAASPNPITTESLAKDLHLKDVNAVAWVRRKMNIGGLDHSVRLGRLMTLGKVQIDGKPRTAYTATNRLLEALKQVPE